MSLILPLQEAVSGRLSNSGLVRPVAVVARRKGNVRNEIEAALAQLGLCLFVFPPLLRQIRPNSTGLFAESIEIRVRVIENPVLNKQAENAWSLVESTLYLLHHWSPGVVGVNQLHALSDAVRDVEDEQRVIFDCLFATSGGYTPRTA